MAEPLARNDFRIEVRCEGARGNPDEVRVTLKSPNGELLHDYREAVDGQTARTVYEALMTALAKALRHDCRHLTVDFAPSNLLDLVRQDRDPELNPVERSLRQWTMYQLRSFDSVCMHGQPLRIGQAHAGARSANRRREGRA